MIELDQESLSSQIQVLAPTIRKSSSNRQTIKQIKQKTQKQYNENKEDFEQYYHLRSKELVASLPKFSQNQNINIKTCVNLQKKKNSLIPIRIIIDKDSFKSSRQHLIQLKEKCKTTFRLKKKISTEKPILRKTIQFQKKSFFKLSLDNKIQHSRPLQKRKQQIQPLMAQLILTDLKLLKEQYVDFQLLVMKIKKQEKIRKNFNVNKWSVFNYNQIPRYLQK